MVGKGDDIGIMVEHIYPYYVYRHVRLDNNVPFYIGKGSKRNEEFSSYSREFERAFSKKRSIVWERVFNKCNGNILIEIIGEYKTLDESINKEIELISLYGRLTNGGTLVNLTDGGEGLVNYICKDETRIKISQSKIGKKQSESAKRHLYNNTWNVGEKHGMSKLTDKDVIDIIQRRSLGEREKDLAVEYGVARQTIQRAKAKKTFKHLFI